MDEARYVNAPALEAFLEKAIAPGGELDGEKNLTWATQLYGLKAGKKAVPVLMKYFLEEPPPPRETGARLSPRCTGAAWGLRDIAGPELIPALEAGALGQDEAKARQAARIIGNMDHKDAEHSLVRLLQRLPVERKRMVARELMRRGSKDITPALIEVYTQAENSTKRTLLETIGYIWGETPPGVPSMSRYATTMDETAAAVLRPKVDAFVLKAIREEKDDVRWSAGRAAVRLKLDEAIPLIEDACAGDLSHGGLRVLQEFANDAAVSALVRLSYVAEHEPEPQRALMQVLERLARLESPLAAPRLLALLDRKEETRQGDVLIRDFAARALGRIYPDGPKWQRKMGRAERDRVIADWKEFLAERGVAPSDALALEDRTKVARFLIKSAGRDTDRVLPPQKIAKLSAARALVADSTDAGAVGMIGTIQERLAPLVRAEVEFLAEMAHAYAVDYRGTYPDPNLPLARAFANYIHLDPNRVSANGDYRDPWGNPYRYSLPEREGRKWVEVRSFGPNGKDEDGQGDDIATRKATQ